MDIYRLPGFGSFQRDDVLVLISLIRMGATASDLI